MKVGDLAYPNKTMRDLKYPEVGIVVEVIGGRYRVAFPDGQVSVFHPAWLENHPKGNRHCSSRIQYPYLSKYQG